MSVLLAQGGVEIQSLLRNNGCVLNIHPSCHVSVSLTLSSSLVIHPQMLRASDGFIVLNQPNYSASLLTSHVFRNLLPRPLPLYLGNWSIHTIRTARQFEKDNPLPLHKINQHAHIWEKACFLSSSLSSIYSYHSLPLILPPDCLQGSDNYLVTASPLNDERITRPKCVPFLRDSFSSNPRQDSVPSIDIDRTIISIAVLNPLHIELVVEKSI
jgi:hypothetical protein